MHLLLRTLKYYLQVSYIRPKKVKKKFAELPTLFFSDRYRKQTIFFSWPNGIL